VKRTLAGVQHFLAHHTTKEEPITVSQLEQLVASKADSMASLYNIHTVVICLLAFAAFLTFDELAKLVQSDVKIENDMLKLFFRRERSEKNRPRESWPRASWCLGERRKKGTTDKASAIDLCVAPTT